MKNKICVYTCITGDYDNLKEIKKENGIDYLCFTNNHNIKSKSWKVIYIKDSSLTNVQLARKIKILGTKILTQYDITVWMDADISWNTSILDFISKKVDLKKFDIVGFKHYCRSSIAEEIIACVEYGKITTSTAKNITDYLNSKNFSDDVGLLETTILFRNFNNLKLVNAMNDWFNMIINYTHRDQLSFNYVEWKNKLNVNMLDINIWNNRYFSASVHNDKNGKVTIIPFDKSGKPLYDESFSKILSPSVNSFEFTIENYNNYSKIHVLFETNKLLAIRKLSGSYNEYVNTMEIDNDEFFIYKPNVIIINNPKYKKIKINFVIYDEITCYNYVNKYYKRLNDLMPKYEDTLKDLNYYKENYEIVVNSKGWKLLEKLRKLKNKLTRK